MYTLDWLQERVRHHLDQDIGQVFLAEAEGVIVAHTSWAGLRRPVRLV
jgi:hypothetical protein